MPKVPSFLEPRPPMPTDAATLAAFDRLFTESVASGPDRPIDYQLAAPRWQFICHIADTHEVVLHGSGNPNIAEFEPRQPIDTTEFGNQNAVYAASDGLWPMYFAILDRDNFGIFLVNSCVRLVEPDGKEGAPYYFFSISDHALRQHPYRRGTIYFLPRGTFVRQPGGEWHGIPIASAQWASHQPVTPLAKIEVGPEDFPLLTRMRGHDDETTLAKAKADPDGFPWLDA